MGNKRSRQESPDGRESAADPELSKNQDQESDEQEDFDTLNVEFEWFNFVPDIDFHGVKRLLTQLLDVDAKSFNLSALADLILSQPTIGSAIKVDGKETDPWAILSVLNTEVHREKDCMKELLKYLTNKAQTNKSLAQIPDVLKSGKHVGLILSERLINIPPQLAPPLYTMLMDEIDAAVEDGEPYEFSHYLILSKTYLEVESLLDGESRKKKKAKEGLTSFFFHPEDEVLHNHAMSYGSFSYTHEDDSSSDSKRAFQEAGIKPTGHMILIEASKFKGAVDAITDYLWPPSPMT